MIPQMAVASSPIHAWTSSGCPSHTLGTWLYKNAFFNDQMGYAAAIGTLIFVITFAIAVIQLWWNRGKQVEY